ncbi:MAG TPA: glycosyltransferase, partial [Myxococcaceae bacterium]|nr:glycosyltransferase [Myxococcaceae bacterium]
SLGHHVSFFEKDLPFYAAHRDLVSLPGGELCLYSHWDEVLPRARKALAQADVAMVTSYCPDGEAACREVLSSGVPITSFYDLDTPVTLERARRGEQVEYLPEEGLGGFDLVLSYTGGEALSQLRSLLGARWAVPLYGSVDPTVHYRVTAKAELRSDLSYLGTYAANRQEALDRLFLEPARRSPARKFLLAGAQYPQDFRWSDNLYFLQHLAPADHPAFYSTSALTLNVTRKPMAELGYCPSGRLFEAAACGTPVVSDDWEGLDAFFRPGEEIWVARSTGDVLDVLSLSDAERERVGRAARERALNEHTAAHRARELVSAVEEARRPERAAKTPAVWVARQSDITQIQGEG